MLFLDGVGKPRGTTLILSSTLGAGSVERPLCTRTRENFPVWIPCSRDWEREEEADAEGRGWNEDEARIERRGKERNWRDEWERNSGAEIGGEGPGMVRMTGTTRPKGGKIESKGDCWWPYCYLDEIP